MKRSCLVLLCALILTPTLSAQGRRMNPFGRGGAVSGYNMGLLGGQCKSMSKSDAQSIGLKSGQTGLEITSLSSAGVGQRAGLMVGDKIINVGGRGMTDKQDAVYQLAYGMDRVMSRRKKGSLLLGVLRGGKIVKVKVPLPALGPHSSSGPSRCRHCGALIAKSFEFLLTTQNSDGSFQTKVGGVNGAVATTALSGLAMLAASKSPSGAMAKSIAKAKDYLVKSVGSASAFGLGGGTGGGRGRGSSGGQQGMGQRGGGGNWNQTNWALGYGAMFLAEYLARTGDAAVRQKLNWVCRQIEANQETNGGWSHGPGGPNALGYTDFAAVTNVVLSGYGAAGKAKIKLKSTTISRGVSYLIGTSGPSGTIGYSQRRGQKGMGDAGRTAGSVLAFGLCKQSGHPFFRKMAGYFTKNMAKVPEGHASPVHHFGLASLATFQVPGAWKKFHRIFRLELVSARNADGSFFPRPSKESASMGMNSDRSTGPAWATGTYLLAWNLPRRNLLIFTKKGRR